MSKYAVIVENDESFYNDVTGESYHYPERYKGILTLGCKVIYYKGRLRESRFAKGRMAAGAHYFGMGVIGKSRPDPRRGRKDLTCEILNYLPFEIAVPNKVDGKYYEPAPARKELAYGFWRTGVRSISEGVYEAILSAAGCRHTPTGPKAKALSSSDDDEFTSFNGLEGKKQRVFSTRYERNPALRMRAIKEHGLSCMACSFNFSEEYGTHGEGFIHVHHNKALSETGEMRIDPIKDLSVLCPNCHAMIHKERTRTLTVSELKELISKAAKGSR